MMSWWCYDIVMIMLSWCYRDVIIWCYHDAIMTLWCCYHDVIMMMLWWYYDNVIMMMLLWCYHNVIMMSSWCLSWWVLSWCYRDVIMILSWCMIYPHFHCRVFKSISHEWLLHLTDKKCVSTFLWRSAWLTILRPIHIAKCDQPESLRSRSVTSGHSREWPRLAAEKMSPKNRTPYR